MALFDHQNYRVFLRAYIKQLPGKGRGELTRIARHLNVNTTLLSQIFSGTRDFSPEQAFSLSEYLGHTELETEYFGLLVQIERAASKPYRQSLEKRLQALKKDALSLSKRISFDRSLTDEERAIFYSNWIFSATHLLTSTEEKGVTLDQVTSRFGISRNKASEVLHFLVGCGLCVESSGRYKMGVQSTFVERGSHFLSKHHSNWRIKAIQKSESLSENEMMYTGQVSLSKKDFEMIQEQLTETLKNIMTTVKDSPAEEVASLNIDWFWI